MSRFTKFTQFLTVVLFASLSIFTTLQAAPPLTEPVDVIIINDQSIPVAPVETVKPLQGTISRDYLDPGDYGWSYGWDAEDGKIAILDHVSFSILVPSGQIPLGKVYCSGSLGYGLSEFIFPMQYVGVEGALSRYVVNAPVRCYGEGSDAISMAVARDSDSGYTGEAIMSFSAHLVDIPD